MGKVIVLVILMVASFLIAGHNIEGESFSMIAFPAIVGTGLLGWASVELLSSYDECYKEGNILYVLDEKRGYEIVGKAILEGQPIQILIELDTKKRRIALIQPDRNSGFVEVKEGDQTFWIPPGKALVNGCAEDCVFTLTKSKEPINWAH